MKYSNWETNTNESKRASTVSLEISTQGSAPHPRLPHRYPRDQEPKAGKGPNPSPATHIQHTRLWGFVTEHGGGDHLSAVTLGTGEA